jgi:hypothetical protein
MDSFSVYSEPKKRPSPVAVAPKTYGEKLPIFEYRENDDIIDSMLSIMYETIAVPIFWVVMCLIFVKERQENSEARHQPMFPPLQRDRSALFILLVVLPHISNCDCVLDVFF